MSEKTLSEMVDVIAYKTARDGAPCIPRHRAYEVAREGDRRIAALKAELAQAEGSAQRWQTKWAESCAAYHDADKRANQAQERVRGLERLVERAAIVCLDENTVTLKDPEAFGKLIVDLEAALPRPGEAVPLVPPLAESVAIEWTSSSTCVVDIRWERGNHDRLVFRRDPGGGCAKAKIIAARLSAQVTPDEARALKGKEQG